MITVVTREFSLYVSAGEWTDSADGRHAARALRLIDHAVDIGDLASNPVDPDPDLSRAEYVAKFYSGGLVVPPDRGSPSGDPGTIY